jgi:hypothetical protein
LSATEADRLSQRLHSHRQVAVDQLEAHHDQAACGSWQAITRTTGYRSDEERPGGDAMPDAQTILEVIISGTGAAMTVCIPDL